MTAYLISLSLPVYFVAVPVATLVAGLELVAWSVLFTWLDPFAEGLGIAALAVAASSLVDEVSAGVHDHPAIAAIAPLVFCAAMFASGYSLWRTLWWKQRLDRPFRRARHVGKALILLLAFTWVFACNRSFILLLGESMNLKIVCAMSCDRMIGTHEPEPGSRAAQGGYRFSPVKINSSCGGSWSHASCLKMAIRITADSNWHGA